MRKSWEMKQFEDCLEKVVYTNKIKRKDFLENGEYPIVSQEQDFINGYWDNHEDLFELKKPVVIFGDHTQVLKYVDFDFVLGADGVKVLQPKNDIDPRFFYYFLQNIDLGSLGYARHYRLLKEIEVYYPKSLPEQKRIVTILNKAFAAIAKAKANAEQNLKNAKELFESYLQGVFENKGDGWDEKKLTEVANLVDSLHKTPKYIQEGYPMVRVTDIKPGYLNLSKTKKVDKLTFDEFSKRHSPKIGDIVLSRVGTYGVSAIVNTNEPFCLGQNTVFVIPKIDSNYFYYFLNSSHTKEQLDKMVAGTTQPTISLKSIKDVFVPIPSVKEQKQIVQNLDAILTETKKLEAIYQQKVEDLEELKKTVLQKAFNGELT
jgi:type I restriction enzyme, S subunit